MVQVKLYTRTLTNFINDVPSILYGNLSITLVIMTNIEHKQFKLNIATVSCIIT